MPTKRVYECERCSKPLVLGRGRVPRLCPECRTGWKWCNRCAQIRALTHFPVHNGRTGHYCWDCQRAYLEARPKKRSGEKLKRAAACRRCNGAILGKGLTQLCAACSEAWKCCPDCHAIFDRLEIANTGRPLVYCGDCRRRRSREQNARPETKHYQYIRHLRRKFGITKERAEELAAVPVCEACGDPPREGMKLHVDHSHISGEIRGVLCLPCNHTVGHLEKDPAYLEKVRAYLMT